MPPRKRAQSAPKPEDTDDEQTAETVNEPEAGSGGGDQVPAEPTTPGEPADASKAGPEAEAQPDDADAQARSDIQSGQPCRECFPGGWSAKDDSVGAVGCEHGTWQRNPVN